MRHLTARGLLARGLTMRAACAACAALVAGLVLLTSCTTTISLNREAVVVFKEGATEADRDRVRSACADASPRASAEPEGPGSLKSSRVNDVRFRIDKADNAELAKLYDCLMKDPSVKGVSIPDFGR